MEEDHNNYTMDGLNNLAPDSFNIGAHIINVKKCMYVAWRYMYLYATYTIIHGSHKVLVHLLVFSLYGRQPY